MTQIENYLFTKEQEIIIDDVTAFSGNLYFWINENNYSLGFEIFSNRSLFYTINSAIGDLDLMFSQISVLGGTGSHGYQLGSLYFPSAPTPPGSYSETYNITLSSSYDYISFRLIAGTSYLRVEIEHEILPYTEPSEEPNESRKELWNDLYNYTATTAVVVAIFLSCMILESRKK